MLTVICRQRVFWGCVNLLLLCRKIMFDEPNNAQCEHVAAIKAGTKEPPSTWPGIIRYTGPGLIMAGCIVGSGELIATTSTGGKAGMYLLWLIIFGCIIKVFTQIEFGRYAIYSGQTTMAMLNDLPCAAPLECCLTTPNSSGKSKIRFNLFIGLTLLLSATALITSTAGILAGVGQAMSLCLTVTEQGEEFNDFHNRHTKWIVESVNYSNPFSVRAGIELKSYQNMRLLWQSTADTDAEGTLERGQTRFLRHCQKVNYSCITQRTVGNDESEFNVAKLISLLGGEKAARDLGADVYANDTRALLSSLGAWPSAVPRDDMWWALAAVVLTSALLATGHYRFIQHFSTSLVLAFTAVSVINLALLQLDDAWRISWSDIGAGLSFRLPTIAGDNDNDQQNSSNQKAALSMAMSTFGVIGVSFSELIEYPYWCVGKGYARYVGPRPVSSSAATQSATKKTVSSRLVVLFRRSTSTISIGSDAGTEFPTTQQPAFATSNTTHTTQLPLYSAEAELAWLHRTRGWMAVLYCDTVISMLLYTFTTIVFYLLGASVLHRTGLDPKGTSMIRYLATMYEPAYGTTARVLFVVGALAVLYSSFFIGLAGKARVIEDALVQLGVLGAASDQKSHIARLHIIGGVLPWTSFVVVATRIDPRQLVLLGGFIQSAFLPVLALAAGYFYFVRIEDDRCKPRKYKWLYEMLLCKSIFLICASGVYACWVHFY